MSRFAATIKHLTIAVLGACCAAALAQGGNPYDGTWSLQIDTPQRSGVQGTVEVRDTGGTWKTVAHDRNDTCSGREAPIEVRSATPEALTLRVLRSRVLSGCQDFTVAMKRVDDTHLQAVWSNGWQFRMTRQ